MMNGNVKDDVFIEARRLHDNGFAVVWIKKDSKAPVGDDWQIGRKTWPELEASYRKGYGIGVQCGANGKLKDGRYLAMIDLDLKSKDPAHRKEAFAAFRTIFGDTLEKATPCVASANGLRYLVATEKPVASKKLKHGPSAKVFLPATKPAEAHVKNGLLTQKESDDGWRIRNAWEIDIMGTGRQGILPPSIHPDTKKPYVWVNHIFSDAAKDISGREIQTLDSDFIAGLNITADGDTTSENTPDSSTYKKRKFVPAEFDLLDVRLDPKWVSYIEDGDGVGADRSAGLLSAAIALLRAGFSDDEITSVFTDKSLYLGQVAYEHAQTKNNRARAANWFHRYTLKRAREEIENDSAAYEGLGEKQTAPPLSDGDAALQKKKLTKTNWKRNLRRKDPPKGAPEGTEGAPLGLLYNVVLILENAVGPDVFKRDLFQLKDIYGCDGPWENAIKGGFVAESDAVHIKQWLSRYWQFEPTVKTIQEAIIHITLKNSFHPIREKLHALPLWDGTPRLNTAWQTYFNVKETDDNREYLAQTFRKWVVASVWRTFEPGKKFDWMIILEGKSGKGKTQFGEILFGIEYYLDGMPSLKDKDAVINMQGQLCAEFGELNIFKNTNIDTIKSFITRRTDKIRLPFDKLRSDMPRQIVFIGTTEWDDYLKADEENRRFMPINAGQIEEAALIRDRDQLWAEALFIYEMGLEESLYLEGKADQYVRDLRRAKFVDDETTVMANRFRKFLLAYIATPEQFSNWFDPTRFKLTSLFETVGGPFEEMVADDRKLIFGARAIKRMGAEKFPSNGANYWKVDIQEFKKSNPDN